MRLTHLGHSCLLVDVDGTRVLVDPGVYSSGLDDLRGLAAIAITHQHPDHLDTDRLPALAAQNPAAALLAEPESAALIGERLQLSAQPLAAGESVPLGPVRLAPLGDQHAFNHDDVPACGNRGILIGADGQPTLFHPGDAYAVTPEGVDILALPLNAPWAAVRDTLAFARAVAPRIVVPIHDGLLSDDGRASYLKHIETFGPAGAQVRPLTRGTPTEV